MREFLFSSECYEEGISYINGIDRENQKIYRWEPLATRFRGEEAASFRRKAEQRRKLLSNLSGETGILVVEGPFNYQSRTFLGWEALIGERLVGSSSHWPPSAHKEYENHSQMNREVSRSSDSHVKGQRSKLDESTLEHFSGKILPEIPVVEGIKKLEVIINTYRLFHQAGLTIGHPDWKRIYIGEKGVFAPDPYLLKFLAAPEVSLPPGLSACYPPEVFAGKKFDEKGDMFFLGIIIYLFFTGELPYPLINGWPTPAILKGEIIPLTFCRPALHPLLARKIESLLIVDPEKRPSSKELVEFWQKASVGVNNTCPRDSGYDLRKKKIAKYYQGRSNWKKIIALTTSGLLLLLLFFTYLRGIGKKPEVTPAMVVEDFLEKASNPTFSGYHPELWMDMIDARKQRIEAASFFLSHPLLEVIQVREVTRDTKRAKIEVILVWHLWDGDVWQTKKTKEFLILEKRNSQWVVQKREPFD